MTKAERKRLQAEERKAQASFELKQEVYGDVSEFEELPWVEDYEDAVVSPLQDDEDYWLRRAEVGTGIALQGHSSAEVNQRLNSVGY